MEYEEEECTLEINGTEYECTRKSEGENGNYIIEVWHETSSRKWRFSDIHIHGMRFRFGLDINSFYENIERDLETIHKEDIIILREGVIFRFKSSSKDYYSSPTYNSNGVKPAKR